MTHHYRTVSGNIESRKYLTYTPLNMRFGDAFAALIIGQAGHLWIRTAAGLLSFLLEENGHGYGGGGPTEFARYVSRLIASGGQDTAAGSGRYDRPDPQILAWASSEKAKRPQELTLQVLRGRLCRSGPIRTSRPCPALRAFIP